MRDIALIVKSCWFFANSGRGPLQVVHIAAYEPRRSFDHLAPLRKQLAGDEPFILCGDEVVQHEPRALLQNFALSR